MIPVPVIHSEMELMLIDLLLVEWNTSVSISGSEGSLLHLLTVRTGSGVGNSNLLLNMNESVSEDRGSEQLYTSGETVWSLDGDPLEVSLSSHHQFRSPMLLNWDVLTDLKFDDSRATVSMWSRNQSGFEEFSGHLVSNYEVSSPTSWHVGVSEWKVSVEESTVSTGHGSVMVNLNVRGDNSSDFNNNDGNNNNEKNHNNNEMKMEMIARDSSDEVQFSLMSSSSWNNEASSPMIPVPVIHSEMELMLIDLLLVEWNTSVSISGSEGSLLHLLTVRTGSGVGNSNLLLNMNESVSEDRGSEQLYTSGETVWSLDGDPLEVSISSHHQFRSPMLLNWDVLTDLKFDDSRATVSMWSRNQSGFEEFSGHLVSNYEVSSPTSWHVGVSEWEGVLYAGIHLCSIWPRFCDGESMMCEATFLKRLLYNNDGNNTFSIVEEPSTITKSQMEMPC